METFLYLKCATSFVFATTLEWRPVMLAVHQRICSHLSPALEVESRDTSISLSPLQFAFQDGWPYQQFSSDKCFFLAVWGLKISYEFLDNSKRN